MFKRRQAAVKIIAFFSVVMLLGACNPKSKIDSSNADNKENLANNGELFASRETIEMDNIEINNYVLQDNQNYDSYTFLATERTYNEYLDIGADVASIYPYGFERKDLSFNQEAQGIYNITNMINSWKEKGYRVDLELSANHDFMRKYVTADEKNRMREVQIDKNGDVVTFAPTIFEMVPNPNWEDHLFEAIERALDLGAEDVGMEESGIFPGSGYSEVFKEMWQQFYNEPWQDPESSLLARMKSETLKQWLFTNQYDNLGKRITAKYPNSRLFFVNHSMFANTHFGTSVDVYGSVAAEGVYGSEGQVWSDTTRPAFIHRGDQVEKPYEYGYMQYSEFATYQRQFPTKPMRVIGDAKGDALNLGWDYYENTYTQNIATQLMFPEFIRFQTQVWPERVFQQKYGDEATLEYKRIVQNIYKILDEIHEKKNVTTGTGSTGIAMAYSANSNMHHDLSAGELPQDAISLGVSLIEQGIPLEIYALESFKDKNALKDIKTLVLSYDFMKPEDIKYNQAIADWVRDGGSLIYVGTKNEYSTITGSWWDNEGSASAEEQLFKLLDINVPDYSKSEATKDLTDGEMKLNQKVGKGNVMVVDFDTKNICLNNKNTDKYIEFVKTAHESTGRRFITTEYTYAIRGDIEIYKALTNPLVIQGNYVDMLAQNQDLITEKRLQAGEVAILRRVTLPTDGAPKLLQSTGFIIDDKLIEEESKTEFTTKAPKGSETVNVFYSATSEPSNITIKDSQGNEVTDFVWKWEEKKKMLRLKNVNDAKGLTITVEWVKIQ